MHHTNAWMHLLCINMPHVANSWAMAVAHGRTQTVSEPARTCVQESKPDYGAVRKAIADVLEKDENYDDGHYGPILVRLAWHASGSYDKASNTGGSNGATMR